MVDNHLKCEMCKTPWWSLLPRRYFKCLETQGSIFQWVAKFHRTVTLKMLGQTSSTFWLHQQTSITCCKSTSQNFIKHTHISVDIAVFWLIIQTFLNQPAEFGNPWVKSVLNFVCWNDSRSDCWIKTVKWISWMEREWAIFKQVVEKQQI